ncbi:MAG: lytic transglycosylase domain-containing protein [Treponema sp.]|nr:lytic transglycosylase domain-containing protein [Treponema sp.]
MNDVKIELIVPVFLGCLVSLILCALLMIHGPGSSRYSTAENQEISLEAAEEESVEMSGFFARAEPERRDIIKELYRQPEAQGWVTEFFTEICASPEVAAVILDNANSFNIAPALAFALCWEESRFNPRAVNSRNRDGSTDRGLFQLNNHSFPRLDAQAFFNPKINAWHGMGHLRHCLNTGGSEIAALAMYNAGTGRVNSTGTPRSTLDYVSRILENRRKIENRFEERLRQELGIFAENTDAIELPDMALLLGGFTPKITVAQPVMRSRFIPLMRLAGRSQ